MSSTSVPEAYFQTLIQRLGADTELETAQRLVVLLLAELVARYEGTIQWPVRDLAEAMGVSRSIVGVVLSHLVQTNPFDQFIQVERPDPGGSYVVRSFLRGKAQAMFAPQPLPAALRQLLLDLNSNSKKVEWAERQQVGDVTIVVVATRDAASKPEKESNTNILQPSLCTPDQDHHE